MIDYQRPEAHSLGLDGLPTQKAQYATLLQLRETTLAAFFDPIPADETLRSLFDRGGVPRYKNNPSARRGGGPVFYKVSAVLKLLRERVTIKLATKGVK